MDAENKFNVLCTWEMGGQLGHISRLAHITQALENKGYHNTVALRDLSRAYPFFRDSETTIMQAPVWLPKIKMQRPIVCLADVLLLSGYLHADELMSMVLAWQALLESVKPDVIVHDYSPTAMLAAHHLDIPSILVGPGFSFPAPGHPLRDWHPYQSQPTLTQQQEQRALGSINTVLSRQNQHPLRHLSELFAVNRTIITTTPDFDLYQDLRQGAIYQCQKEQPGNQQPVQFGPAKGPRILAYLKPHHPNFIPLLQALANCNANVFVACPRGDQSLLDSHKSDHFQYSTQVVELAAAMQQADLFVGHGNSGSTMESLLQGVPVVALPIQLEQLLIGMKAQELGVGKLVQKIESGAEFTAVLNSAVSCPSLKSKTKQFAQQHLSMIDRSLGEIVAEQCAQLLPKRQAG